ncbi:hypothetical protein ACDW82_03220 [Alcaligenes faecalis]|uniref:hypothetical protein n=1 Tax=Alcaligenes TaxID=507 RepID=UPI003557E056
MSVTPVDSSTVPAQTPEASFDDAVTSAQQDEMMLKGVVTLAQTVLMPRMNEILSEAQSDE